MKSGIIDEVLDQDRDILCENCRNKIPFRLRQFEGQSNPTLTCLRCGKVFSVASLDELKPLRELVERIDKGLGKIGGKRRS